MTIKEQNEKSDYSTAALSPDHLDRLITLEKDFADFTHKEIVLIAYEKEELK
ncbi:hypothetical protein K8O68_03920 [Salipaludibacillus sp. CUR1]|uniref:Uncharacterized protein n=1 Tax=Salipaludibacillus aurantiacus TaxID=1601833 RepID=A0A1H9S6M6_9BACI|nr:MULTISPECIES: hypothetical protein [Salipaludibacillus]MCE7791573.1 hypothetical protein [Salipaludibacillus sp. CUR1]SER80621.1 hypothetical protein SAMN05518684_10454 [Salipaludibacillus aurantiacus]